MKTRILTQTFVIALAMTLTIGLSTVFGQNKDDKQTTDALTTEQNSLLNSEEQENALEGTWQITVTPRDCQTGVPEPFSFKALHTYHEGGTLSEMSANPFDGPYRSGGQGIWKRISGRHYKAVLTFFTFEPDKTFTGSVKIKVNVNLSRTSNSFTGDDTLQDFDADGNPIFTGCDNLTATRLNF